MLEAIVNNYLAWGLEISKCEKCKSKFTITCTTPTKIISSK